MSEPKFTEGQEVIATGNGGPITMQVHKVGTKFVYASRFVDSKQWRRFRLTDGYEENARGTGGHLWTLEEWAEHCAFGEAIVELRTLGLVRNAMGGTAAAKATTAQIRAIIDILREES